MAHLPGSHGKCSCRRFLRIKKLQFLSAFALAFPFMPSPPPIAGGRGETGHVAGATASGGTRTTRPSRQGASVPSSDASVLPRRSLGCAVRKGCGRAASPKGCSPFPHPTRRSFQMGTGSSRVGRCLARGHEPVPGAARGRLHPSSSKGQPGRRGRGGTRRALRRAGPARVSPHWVSRLP